MTQHGHARELEAVKRSHHKQDKDLEEPSRSRSAHASGEESPESVEKTASDSSTKPASKKRAKPEQLHGSVSEESPVREAQDGSVSNQPPSVQRPRKGIAKAKSQDAKRATVEDATRQTKSQGTEHTAAEKAKREVIDALVDRVRRLEDLPGRVVALEVEMADMSEKVSSTAHALQHLKKHDSAEGERRHSKSDAHPSAGEQEDQPAEGEAVGHHHSHRRHSGGGAGSAVRQLAATLGQLTGLPIESMLNLVPLDRCCK